MCSVCVLKREIVWTRYDLVLPPHPSDESGGKPCPEVSLEGWNAAVGVEERKSNRSVNLCSSSTDDKK